MSDDSKIVCNEIISIMHIVSIKMKNTIATKIIKNCYSKKVWDCCFLQTFLLVIILHITIIRYHYVIQSDIHALTTYNEKQWIKKSSH